MPKGLKIILILLLPVALTLGAAYGLAKIHIIKLPPNPALRPIWKAIGLKPPVVPAPTAAALLAAKAPDPLLAQKKALDAEKAKLAEDRAAMEETQQVKAKGDAYTAAQNALDPRSVARMATVYEQMPTEKAVPIFAVLPDAQALALLRSMDEKKVAEILAAEPPARAARFTLALAHAK